MYIISKQKDYYDGVVGTVGIDKTIVYEREIVEITDNKKLPTEFRHHHWTDRRENQFLNVCRADIDKDKTKKYVNSHGFIVGFCGKLYLGWKLDYEANGWNTETGEPVVITKTDFVYGYDEGRKYLKADYWRSNLDDDVKYVMNYDPIEIFRKFKTPIFVYDHDSRSPRIDVPLIINANLKEYEFAKVVDAFTAFTELQMFISGVLGTGEKELIEIEDRYKIGQHGFDKWSFRRMPSKKK